MKVEEPVSQIKKYLLKNGFPDAVEAAVILGSGLSGFTSQIDNSIQISYHSIPEFPVTSVQGHDGTLIYGVVKGNPVVVFSGRFHHYEGFPFSTTVLPVQIANAFSANKIIISNAAGAVNPDLNVSDLLVIDDVFRLFQKVSPQPSKKYIYNLYPAADKVRRIAANMGLEVHRGSYLYVKGPNYETKAEIRAFQRLGVDVVGMSTVPELTEAARLKISAVAISLVTNMAAGISSQKLDHSEVNKAAENRKDDFAKLVIELIQEL